MHMRRFSSLFCCKDPENRCTPSLARPTPVWKNRGLVTALHTTSSDGMQLVDMVGRAAVAELTKCKDGVNNN